VKCARCGSELVDQGLYCGTCGAPRSKLPSRFAEAMRRFTALKGRFEKGELDDAAYEAALRELILQDEQGQYWMIGTDSAEWYLYDGVQWIRKDPPLVVAPSPGSPSAPAGRPAAPVPTAVVAGKGFPWIWVVLALVVVLALILAAVVVAWRFPSLLPFDLGRPTATSVPPTAAPTIPPVPTEVPTPVTPTPTEMPIVAPTAGPTTVPVATPRATIGPAPTPIPTETPLPGVRLYFPLFFR
jgi:hypothetical protein